MRHRWHTPSELRHLLEYVVGLLLVPYDAKRAELMAGATGGKVETRAEEGGGAERWRGGVGTGVQLIERWPNFHTNGEVAWFAILHRPTRVDAVCPPPADMEPL